MIRASIAFCTSALVVVGLAAGPVSATSSSAKGDPKACTLLTSADFKKAGVTTALTSPTENPGGALAPGGSACDWTATGSPFVELAFGRNLRQRTIMQFFATRVTPITGLPAGSVYVEADKTATEAAYNGFVVKHGTLVVTFQATVETVPKAAMLALAKTLNSRVH